jgi:beta-barrel assembly-enhancing protease
MKIRCLSLILLAASVLLSCRTVDVRSADTVGFLTSSVTSAVQASRPISDSEEYYVGRAVCARILAQYQLINNWRLTEYVNTVGTTVAIYSDKPITYGGYHFGVLDTMEPNAFACPGGMILVSKGMVMTARTEDELAAVLAHEIGHISHRDGISSIQQSRWSSALTAMGSQAVHTYGSSSLSQMVSLFEGSIDDVFKTLVVNGYSRSAEMSADEAAFGYLVKAGYNPHALRTVLETLNKSPQSGGIMKTHPGTSDRIEAIAKKGQPLQIHPAAQQARDARFRAAPQ